MGVIAREKVREVRFVDLGFGERFRATEGGPVLRKSGVASYREATASTTGREFRLNPWDRVIVVEQGEPS